jgi:hypothetical protein
VLNPTFICRNLSEIEDMRMPNQPNPQQEKAKSSLAFTKGAGLTRSYFIRRTFVKVLHTKKRIRAKQ